LWICSKDGITKKWLYAPPRKKPQTKKKTHHKTKTTHPPQTPPTTQSTKKKKTRRECKVRTGCQNAKPHKDTLKGGEGNISKGESYYTTSSSLWMWVTWGGGVVLLLGEHKFVGWGGYFPFKKRIGPRAFQLRGRLKMQEIRKGGKRPSREGDQSYTGKIT